MEIFEPETRHEMPLWKLIDAVQNNGGNIDSTIVFEADGEPVYIEMFKE